LHVLPDCPGLTACSIGESFQNRENSFEVVLPAIPKYRNSGANLLHLGAITIQWGIKRSEGEA
jgi:hypothetical protein